MMNKMNGLIAVLGLIAAGCVDDGKDGDMGAQGAAGTDGENGTPGEMGAPGTQGPAGPAFALPGVYTLSNAASGNQVAAYVRASNGNLSRKGSFTTGANGTGAGLGSQGALAFDPRSQRFFAVNTGSNSISMLTIDADGDMMAMSTVASGGSHPVSITVKAGIVYVANQGDTTASAVGANISGFMVQGDQLVPIAGSTRPLSGTTDVHPTDIAFSPDGKFLVVAERLANKLDTFAVVGGVAQPGSFQTSAGMQPFAFDFSPEGYLVVAEVGTGAAGASSASSYALSSSGQLSAVTSALPTLQSAACWLAMAGGYAYIANAASANITGLNVSETGQLTLHEASGITATTAAGSIDLAVPPDRGYLYALAGNPKQIYIFAIRADGSLAAMPALPNVPAAAAGLIAR
jgi:6-phosphogluconolactonase (cycloisomerase 2 family)